MKNILQKVADLIGGAALWLLMIVIVLMTVFVVGWVLALILSIALSI